MQAESECILRVIWCLRSKYYENHLYHINYFFYGKFYELRGANNRFIRSYFTVHNIVYIILLPGRVAHGSQLLYTIRRAHLINLRHYLLLYLCTYIGNNFVFFFSFSVFPIWNLMHDIKTVIKALTLYIVRPRHIASPSIHNYVCRN